MKNIRCVDVIYASAQQDGDGEQGAARLVTTCFTDKNTEITLDSLSFRHW